MIISASRRTDIPAFYSDWFFNRIKEGYVLVRNPMNAHQISKISLSADVIDCIVFWTKNPRPMINRLDELKDYNYYFQFTLNSYAKDIEPNVPSKDKEIIKSFRELSEKIGKETVVVNNVNTDNKKASSGHNAQQRDLMDSAEVGRLDMTDEIIMLAHYQPCIDKKYNTTSHPMWKYTRDYIEKQQGKEKFMMYDTARFPDMKKDIPLFIEVGEHSDNITHIGVFTEQACMEAIGKFGTELENAVQGDINDFFNTVTEDT